MSETYKLDPEAFDINIRAATADGLDCSNLIYNERLSDLHRGKWTGEVIYSGMKFGGFYKTPQPGMLFVVGTPGCPTEEKTAYAESDLKFGFFVDSISGICWFVLKCGENIGLFDAPFQRIRLDMGAFFAAATARNGQLATVDLAFVDGQDVVVRRANRLDPSWIARLGDELWRLRPIETAAEAAVALRDSCARYSLKQVLERADMGAIQPLN